MKFKLFVLLLSTALFIPACGNKETVIEKEHSSTASEVVTLESDSTAESKKNILSVEVVVPSTFFEDDITQNTLDEKAINQGFEGATLNSNGSVTYKMSKLKQKEMLEDIIKQTDETCENLINGEDPVDSFQKIEYDEGMTKFIVYVDKATFSNLDTFNTFLFYFSGRLYQIYNCIPADAIDVRVDYIDKDTSVVLNTGKLSESNSTNSVPEDISSESDILREIDDWLVGDIWNNFVDFQSYRSSGKDCTGSTIDIDFAYDGFKESYKLKDKYNEFIMSLSDDYAPLKNVWPKMIGQMELLYADLETNGLDEGAPRLDLDLFDQYSSAFNDEANKLD